MGRSFSAWPVVISGIWGSGRRAARSAQTFSGQRLECIKALAPLLKHFARTVQYFFSLKRHHAVFTHTPQLRLVFLINKRKITLHLQTSRLPRRLMKVSVASKHHRWTKRLCTTGYLKVQSPPPIQNKLAQIRYFYCLHDILVRSHIEQSIIEHLLLFIYACKLVLIWKCLA